MVHENYIRSCPKCSIILEYASIASKCRADKKKVLCSMCSGRYKKIPPFLRNCPKCNVELQYKNIKNRNRANKYRKICSSCSAKEVQNRPNVKEKRSIDASKRVGELNPFFGKQHSEESKQKMILNKDFTIYKTDEFKEKISNLNSGKNNPMCGKSFYSIWVVKYGEEEANQKLAEYKIKQSIALSGENNPMYGKPAPKGSGGGWSGWYKGWYFRSLRELAYMINVIQPNNYQWVTGEKTSIPYTDIFGNNKTYRPDFIINNNIMVEIKPIKLMLTPNNILKKQAGENYCANNNMEYRMIDISIIKKSILLKLIEEGLLVLTNKYKIKIQDKYAD